MLQKIALLFFFLLYPLFALVAESSPPEDPEDEDTILIEGDESEENLSIF